MPTPNQIQEAIELVHSAVVDERTRIIGEVEKFNESGVWPPMSVEEIEGFRKGIAWTKKELLAIIKNEK